MTTNLPQLPIIVCSKPVMIANSIINSNAYPDVAESEATACVNRFSLVLHNASCIQNTLVNAQRDFLDHLTRNWMSYRSAAPLRPDLVCVIYWNGIEYTTVLHSILYEIRAFFDIYARLIGKIIGEGTPPVKFSSRKVGGKSVPGARFCDWLQSLNSSSLPQKTNILGLITAAVDEWMETAFEYRDALAHFRDMPGLVHMHVPLTLGPDKLDPSCIVMPTLPNGIPVDEYANYLCNRLGNFIEQTMLCLPSVDIKLLSTWEQAIKR